LDQVLAALPRRQDENVLIGFDTADDAGVYRLAPDLAIVQTVDFFTPIVDDPHTFGAIAAANALSDVWAMGGRPVSALSVLAWSPSGELEDLQAILRGGSEKMAEAGCTVVGGHSVSDPEIKFGYAVTGVIHPDRILANSGAVPGDALVFTKRLGTGVVATALKREMAAGHHVQAAIESMLTLNRRACEAMLEGEAHACTDVTGFGLIGHAREMALASKVTLEIDVAAIHFLPGALDYAREGAIPGGLRSNREFAAPCVDIQHDLRPEHENLLYDPQTSGGLLIALPEEDALRLERDLPCAYRMGRVLPQLARPVRLI
jgi:selenide,water dikinase